MADVAITVEGYALPLVVSYTLSVDILTPSDSLEFRVPADADTLARLPLDGVVRCTFDDAPVFTGRIESRQLSGGQDLISVTCLDAVGRLVAESVPGAGRRVLGRRMSTELAELVQPHLSRVEFSNASDRRLRLGRGKRPRTGTEPALTTADRLASVQNIEAGTTRWAAIERITRAYQLLAWSSGDGSTLIVARPNYDQTAAYELYETRDVSNVLGIDLTASNAGRYAEIEVSGSGFPPGISPPPRVQTTPGVAPLRFVSANKIGRVLDGPNPDGTGGDFRAPKRLIVVSEALSQREAAIEAARLAARGRAQARQVSVRVADHGQIRDGTQRRTLYAPDTIARVTKTIPAAPGRSDHVTILDVSLYVTAVRYEGTRDSETTTLSLVPLDILLI